MIWRQLLLKMAGVEKRECDPLLYAVSHEVHDKSVDEMKWIKENAPFTNLRKLSQERGIAFCQPNQGVNTYYLVHDGHVCKIFFETWTLKAVGDETSLQNGRKNDWVDDGCRIQNLQCGQARCKQTVVSLVIKFRCRLLKVEEFCLNGWWKLVRFNKSENEVIP